MTTRSTGAVLDTVTKDSPTRSVVRRLVVSLGRTADPFVDRPGAANSIQRHGCVTFSFFVRISTNKEILLCTTVYTPTTAASTG